MAAAVDKRESNISTQSIQSFYGDDEDEDARDDDRGRWSLGSTASSNATVKSMRQDEASTTTTAERNGNAPSESGERASVSSDRWSMSSAASVRAIEIRPELLVMAQQAKTTPVRASLNPNNLGGASNQKRKVRFSVAAGRFWKEKNASKKFVAPANATPKTVRLRRLTIVPNPLSQVEETQASLEAEDVRFRTLDKLDKMMADHQGNARALLIEEEANDLLRQMSTKSRRIALQAAPDLRQYFNECDERRPKAAGAEAQAIVVGRRAREREITIPLHDLMVALCHYIAKEIKAYDPSVDRYSMTPLPRRVADFIMGLRQKTADYAANKQAKQDFLRRELKQLKAQGIV